MKSETGQFFLTAAALVSFFAATLVMALLVRSFWKIDMLVYRVNTAPPDGKSWTLFSNRGWVRFGFQEDDVPTADGLSYTRHPIKPWTGFTKLWQRLGFGYDSARNFRTGSYTIHYRTVTFPLWFFASLLLMLPATELYRYCRRRRIEKALDGQS